VEEIAFQLNIANAVWGQKELPYLPEYLDVLARDYGAGIQLSDFRGNPRGAVAAINGWVSDETEGLIQNVVSDLSPDTALVLANAIYFNADWNSRFDEEATYEEPFHLLDGGQESVPMMHQTAHFSYAEGTSYQAIELPYRNRGVAMVILLPREGQFRDVEERSTGEWVQDVVGGFSEHEVILTMPKFRLEPPALSLKEALSGMGMRLAFADNADFFGIIEPGSAQPICIGDVLHKAFIDVNERRTEAAATTIVEMVPVSEQVTVDTPPPPIVMKVDRPFMFFIRDINTNAIVFVGRLMKAAP